MNGEKVKIARLFEKTSASGNLYFTGRMGQARVLLFRDKKSEAEGEWALFVQAINDESQKPAPRPELAGENAYHVNDLADGTAFLPRRRKLRGKHAVNEPLQAKASPTMPDDPVPF